MKAELNRKLHAAATALVGKERAHEMLHLTIEQAPFFKDSLSELSDKEAEALLEGFEKQIKIRGKQVNAALGEPGLLSEAQLKYINDMINELGWSENYVATVLKNRWQIYDKRVEKLSAYHAIKVIALLKERVERKRATLVEASILINSGIKPEATKNTI